MTSESADVYRAGEAVRRAEGVRRAVVAEWDAIGLAIAAVVRSALRDGPRHEWARRAEDVLGETIRRALARPETYQPDRPILPWLVGIAHNVLRGEIRRQAGRPRRIDLDEATWDRLLGVLDPDLHAAASRIDVEAMLARLAEPARRALTCRYLRGLDGDALAEALAVPTAGAARVRVARALQALRELYASDAPEVTR